MAPNIVEVVFALGRGDSVVGVADFTVFPPQATSITKVGGYIDPHFEKITRLQPDLILLQGTHRRLHEFCRKNGIQSLSVDMNDMDSIFEGIMIIGSRLGSRLDAEKLVQSIQAELEIVRAAVRGKPRPRIFVSLGRKPGSLTGLFTTGNNGFVGELITIAGGYNVFGELTAYYPQISKEALVRQAPDIIIETFAGQKLSTENINLLRQDWHGLAIIPAVKNGNIHILTDDFLLVPGPRIAQTARRFAAIFHPT